MHVLLENLRVEHSDYEGAVKSFERARAQMRNHRSRLLFVILLVSFLTAVFRRIEIALSLTDIWMEIS